MKTFNYNDDFKYKLFCLELTGVVISFICATLLHFSYDWSNGAIWSLLFGAANESVWEHIKILTFPYLCWSIIELAFIRIPLKKLVIAKTAGIYTIIILTIVVFKIYTFFVGHSIPLVDISSAFLWLIAGFFISYKIILSGINSKLWFTSASFALIIYLVMFMTFTINPPQWDIFEDPITHSYGISSKNIDLGAIAVDNFNNKT